MGNSCSNHSKVINCVVETTKEDIKFNNNDIVKKSKDQEKSFTVKKTTSSLKNLQEASKIEDNSSYDYYSDSYYDGTDSDYEYINVTETDESDGEEEALKSDIHADSESKSTTDPSDSKRKWKIKAQLSEVIEDTENLEVSENFDSPEISKSVINQKKSESLMKRVKSASAPQLDEGRRDSSLVGVFSAIKLSNKWKSKLNSKKIDDEGNVAEAVSTFSITKRWKKKLRHVRSKIKKKDDETDNINAAHITHKWKRQMRKSKENKEGNLDSNRRKSESSQKSRRRKLESKRDKQVSEFLDDGRNIINNTTQQWNMKDEKSGQVLKD